MTLAPILIEVSFNLYVALTISDPHPSCLAAVHQTGCITEEHIGSLSTATKAILCKIFENEPVGLTVYQFSLFFGDHSRCFWS